jgi:hypothetical protein
VPFFEYKMFEKKPVGTETLNRMINKCKYYLNLGLSDKLEYKHTEQMSPMPPGVEIDLTKATNVQAYVDTARVEATKKILEQILAAAKHTA